MIYRGHAFSLSYDSAFPPLLPPPRSHQQVVSLTRSSCASPIELTDWRGGGGGGERAKPYDGEKAWSYINNLILSPS
jgi:hypothetical protein